MVQIEIMLLTQHETSIFSAWCPNSWNKHPKWTMERIFSYLPPPIIMSCALLFNGASNSVTDFLNSPSCYQLLLYFQSVKLTSWSVPWIQLSDCVRLKIAKSCKCACLDFSFVKGRGWGLSGASNCRSFKIGALRCEFNHWLLLGNIFWFLPL